MRLLRCIMIPVLGIYLLGGCGGGSSGSQSPDLMIPPPAVVTPPVVPKITTSNPLQGKALVGLNQVIEISFESPLSESSIENSFSINNSIDGSLSYRSSDNTIVFTPNKALPESAEIIVTISESLLSKTNTQLGQDYTFTFYTRGSVSESAQQAKNNVAIIDLSAKNQSSQTDLVGLRQALEIAGVTYSIIDNFDELSNNKIVFITSFINNSTLDIAEQNQIKIFAESGGIVIARGVSASSLYDLFGIESRVFSRYRQDIIWDVNSNDQSLKYVGGDLEASLSLGSDASKEQLGTSGYTLTTGKSLAQFGDGSHAIVTNAYGQGETFLFGTSFSDLTLRNQLNFDYDAQRGGINEIENTTDQFILFLRAILETRLTNFVWKHTSSKHSHSTLMVTHDIDSQSGADLLQSFMALEKQFDVSATYNITTRYFNDAIDSDFYSMNIDTYKLLLKEGHEVASHSVGHFRDFDDHDTIPLGAPGNTTDRYLPYNDGTTTQGATVYGELEVSKNLLVDDLGATIKTFRSGHLLRNEHQAEVLESLDYRFDSSVSGQDSLTSFPFLLSYEKSLSSQLSSIYVLPITISDSISNNSSALDVAEQWLKVVELNRANFSPTVLLIHPNRESKLEQLEMLLNLIPNDIATRTIESYGEFWAARQLIDVSSYIENNTLFIAFNTDVDNLNSDFSVIVEDGVFLHDVSVTDSNSEQLSFESYFVSDNKVALHTFNLK